MYLSIHLSFYLSVCSSTSTRYYTCHEICTSRSTKSCACHEIWPTKSSRSTKSPAPATKSALQGPQSPAPATNSALPHPQSPAPATKCALQGPQSTAPATKHEKQKNQKHTKLSRGPFENDIRSPGSREVVAACRVFVASRRCNYLRTGWRLRHRARCARHLPDAHDLCSVRLQSRFRSHFGVDLLPSKTVSFDHLKGCRVGEASASNPGPGNP